LRGRFSDALTHAHIALRFAERTGAAFGIATAHGNLANLLFVSGDYKNAAQHQDLASTRLPRSSDNYIAALDLHSQIAIAENRLDDASSLLGTIEALTRSLQRPSGYAQRHASMTRIDLLRRLGQHDAALVTADRVIRAAVAAGDVLLQHVAGLVKTELFVHTHKLDEAQTTLSTVIDTISQQQPTVYAKYQSVLSELLRYNRAILSATAHTERARRFYKTL